MSKYAPRQPRGRGDPSASQDFLASAADALTAPKPVPSIPPSQIPEVVAIDQATADGRRIYRENVPIPAATSSAVQDVEPQPTPSVSDPPLDLHSLPAWAPFFRDDTDDAEDNGAEPAAEEHARRYVNSVSFPTRYIISGGLMSTLGHSDEDVAARSPSIPRRASQSGRAQWVRGRHMPRVSATVSDSGSAQISLSGMLSRSPYMRVLPVSETHATSFPSSPGTISFFTIMRHQDS